MVVCCCFVVISLVEFRCKPSTTGNSIQGQLESQNGADISNRTVFVSKSIVRRKVLKHTARRKLLQASAVVSNFAMDIVILDYHDHYYSYYSSSHCHLYGRIVIVVALSSSSSSHCHRRRFSP